MKTTTNEQGKLTPSYATNSATFEVIDLGPFDSHRNDVQALNNDGQMAGASVNAASGQIEAFIEERGTRTPLGTLGGSFSIARDINDRGEIVGGSLTAGDENFHGFLFRDNRLYDLNKLLDPSTGCELIQAFAINDRGEIIGLGCLSGRDRIVLLRPKP